MAHQPILATNANGQTITRESIDQTAEEAVKRQAPAAAETAAQDAPVEPPTLAIGAEGEHVTKLANLLYLLGYATNTVITQGGKILDQTVMSDVHAARQALGIIEPELEHIKGDLVGPTTWDALYQAASLLSKEA